MTFGSKFLINFFFLGDVFIRIWCLYEWKIGHVSFLCIFKRFSSLSFQFLNIKTTSIKSRSLQRAKDTALRHKWTSSLPVSEQSALLLAQMWHHGTEGELDVQGTNPGPPSWHRHCCAGLWKRPGWRGGETRILRRRQLTFSPLLSSWTADPSVASGSLEVMSARKVVWNSHCLPTPATQLRPWSRDLMVIPWWAKSI